MKPQVNIVYFFLSSILCGMGFPTINYFQVPKEVKYLGNVFIRKRHCAKSCKARWLVKNHIQRVIVWWLFVKLDKG